MLVLVKERIAPVFAHVGTAVNIKSAIEQPINQANMGFVVPVSERPASNKRDLVGKPLQDTIITFGVVLGLKNINDPTGEKGLEKLGSLRESLRKKLFGWSPNDAYQSVLLANSDLIGFAPNGIWWLDRFTTQTWYEGGQS